MTREDLKQEIEQIAREVFEKPELKITDGMSASDIDTWTSLSFMHFIMAIEEKYNIKFKMLELLKLKSMGVIVDITLTHLQ